MRKVFMFLFVLGIGCTQSESASDAAVQADVLEVAKTQPVDTVALLEEPIAYFPMLDTPSCEEFLRKFGREQRESHRDRDRSWGYSHSFV